MTPIKLALDALNQGDKVKAKEILAKLVSAEPQNVDAWLLLSKTLDDPKQASYCKERAQAILQARIKQNTSGTAIQQPAISQAVGQQLNEGQPTKQCPYCAMSVPTAADVCPHCQRDINPKIMYWQRVREGAGVMSQLGIILMVLGCVLPCIVLVVLSMFQK